MWKMWTMKLTFLILQVDALVTSVEACGKRINWKHVTVAVGGKKSIHECRNHWAYVSKKKKVCAPAPAASPASPVIARDPPKAEGPIMKPNGLIEAAGCGCPVHTIQS